MRWLRQPTKTSTHYSHEVGKARIFSATFVSEQNSECFNLITGSLPTYVVPSTALLLILKMGHPRPLFNFFSVFSNKPNKCTQQQMNVMNYPFCMRCRDSNARPLDCQSPPIISRPGPVGQRCTLLQTSFTVQGTSGPCDNVSKLSESLSILNTFVHSLLLNI